MDNPYITTPIKLIIVDPFTSKAKKVYVIIGNIPKNVYNAIQNYADGGSSSSTKDILKNFYGRFWKEKLYFDKVITGAPVVGGCDEINVNALDIADINEAIIGGDDINQINFDDDSDTIYGSRNDKQQSQNTDDQSDELVEFLNNPADRPNVAAEIMDIDDPNNINFSEVDLLVKESTNVNVIPAENTHAIDYTPDVEYVTTMPIFSVDKISEVKEKVYLLTQIPIYRQHLFYYSSNKVMNSYTLSVDTNYNINILDTSVSTHILNIPIDKYLFNNRDDVKVISYDSFTLIGDKLIAAPYLFVVDVENYMAARPQFEHMDINQIMRIYYGFILKFFPMMSREIFNDYLLSPATIAVKYPEIAPLKGTLTRRFNIENEITNQIYKVNTLENLITKRSPVKIALTYLLSSVNQKLYMINLRNLFDKLRVSKCIPEVVAHLSHKQNNYFVRKSFILNDAPIHFPAQFKTGLTLAISLRKEDQENFHERKPAIHINDLQNRYMYINVQPNGRYFVRSQWNEEEEYTFDEITKILRYFTDNVIATINAMGRAVFPNGGQLEPITKQNIRYDNMNISIFWKKIITSSGWKNFRDITKPFVSAGIMNERNISSEVYEFNFLKGVIAYDVTSIEKSILAATGTYMQNYYNHLTNSNFKVKWDQKFGGRVFKIIHRTTDIKFEVLDIHESEFDIFYRYVIVMISRAICNEAITRLEHQVATTSTKKLRKLKEMDPELFNLKRYGESRAYSRLCQKKAQPHVYLEEELEHMSKQEKREIVKYWNFTMHKPAYYGCPSSKYPHLSFLVNIHPKDYCLPCCEKIKHGEESRKETTNIACLRSYVYTKHEEATSKHIMVYSHDIPPTRMAYLQSSMSELLYGTNENYVLYGVAQHFGIIKNVGVLSILSVTLDKSIAEIIQKICKVCKASPLLFNHVCSRRLEKYFISNENFIGALLQIFVYAKELSYESIRFKQWNDLFIELALYVFNIIFISFYDTIGSGEKIKIYVPDIVASDIIARNTSDKKFILCVKNINYYYPIYTIVTNDRIDKKIFSADTQVIHIISSVINNVIAKPDRNKINKTITLHELKQIAGLIIERKYINMHNVAYGVDVNVDNVTAFIPIELEANSADGIAITYEVNDRANTKYSDLMTICETINLHIKKFHSIKSSTNTLYVYALIAPTRYIRYNGKIIGFESPPCNYYFDGEPEKTIKDLTDNITEILYDPTELNRVIVAKTPMIEDARTERLGSALYSVYKYQLLVLEFMNYIQNERNQSVRTRLHKLIDSIDLKNPAGYASAIESLTRICHDPADTHTIGTHLTDFYYEHNDRNTLSEIIDKSVYNFDRETLNKMKHHSSHEMKREIREILAKITTAPPPNWDASAVTFPNIYLPCSEKTKDNNNKDGSYCINRKLIIDKVGDYVDILAADLRNPIKEQYLLSGLLSDNTIDYFDFATTPAEVITLRKE